MQLKLIKQVRPVYPALALDARITGVVRLEMMIDRNGAVESTKVISGHPFLTQAARDAVSQSRYTPTIINGEPVRVISEVAVKFELSLP